MSGPMTAHAAVTRGIERALADLGVDLVGCSPSVLSGHVIKELRSGGLLHNLASLSPSETLRAAAEKLLELAEHATPGPWQPCENPGGAVGVDVKPTDRMGIFVVGPVSEAGMEWVDARWIAALSPSVAEPLAAWLLEEAHALEELTPSHIPSPAVAFARCILGGQDG